LIPPQGREIEPGKRSASVSAELPFDVLADSVDLAVRHLDRFGRGAVLRTILGQAGPDGDALAYRVLEVAPLSSAPLQSGKRNGFKSPRV